MPEQKYVLEKELKKWFVKTKRVVVAGIGNPIRMDDAVGVKIVQDLLGKVSDRVLLIECETVPESFLQQIVDFNPSHVLLIDAAVMSLKHGEARLVNPEQLSNFPAYTTHMLPLRIFCEYLNKTIRTKIALLLIEPKNTEFGERLTTELQAAARYTTRSLIKLLP